jgi:hypothetical protein
MFEARFASCANVRCSNFLVSVGDISMTVKMFYLDSYLTQLDAVVSQVNDEWVGFDQTIFYPQGVAN